MNINSEIIQTKFLNFTHSSPFMLLRKYFRFSPADFSPEWVSNPAALSTSPMSKYQTFVSFNNNNNNNDNNNNNNNSNNNKIIILIIITIIIVIVIIIK